MKKKSSPMRICVGCEELKEKRDLLRVVMNSEGAMLIDRMGKAPGRGAYLCESEECLEKAFKAKRLERSFKRKVSPEIYEALRKELKHE